MKSLFHNIEQTQEFFNRYGLDINTGVSFSQNYIPHCFDKQIFTKFLRDMHTLVPERKTTQYIRDLPELVFNYDADVSSFTRIRDAKLFQALLEDILHVYIAEQRTKGLVDQQIVVPAKLGLPLLKVCEFLGVTFGTINGPQHRWRYKKVPTQSLSEDLKFEDFQITSFFTEGVHHFNESLFWLGNFIGFHYFYNCVKLLHQAQLKIEKEPQNCQEYCQKVLIQVNQFMKKLIPMSLELMEKLATDFLTSALGPFFAGFEGIKVEGLDKEFTCGGGSGGNDSTIPIFEALIGITLPPNVVAMRACFKKAYTKHEKELIEYFEQNSFICEYCEMNPGLNRIRNQIIQQYANFFSAHGALMRRFNSAFSKRKEIQVPRLFLEIAQRDSELKKLKS